MIAAPLFAPLDTAGDLVVISPTLCRAGSQRLRFEQQQRRSAPQKPSAALPSVWPAGGRAARNGEVMVHACALRASFVGGAA